MSRPPLERHRRAFRCVQWLYPKWFRDLYGEEMALMFDERLGRAAGTRGRLGLWWRMLKDAGSTAWALRRRDILDGGPRMETLLQDVRYAVRHLSRAPAFTAGAVALLAVGIGANTTVFSLVDALIFRPPPWDHPEEVVHVYQDSDDGDPNASSFPATRDMAESDVFSAVAATQPSQIAWDRPDGSERASIEYTTSPYLTVLGRAVQRGRWFGPEDDVVGGAPVAVVSGATWHTKLADDPDVVGRTIILNGQPVTIVGVGPEGVTGSTAPLITDFWLSISATRVGGNFQVTNLERRENHWYDVLARLAPGVTVTQAQAAMDALAGRLARDYPEFNRGRGITVFPARDVRVHPQGDGTLRVAGGLLTSVALAVLLLACANLANLLLVRGLGRSGEMAVRSALGASRARVARLFLLESLLLAGAGGLVGLLLTRWAVAGISSLAIIQDALRGTPELSVDVRVAVFAIALMLLTGTLFGLAPTVRSVRADVARTLRDDARTTSGDRGTGRLRGFLVAVQVAASLVLVLTTGLLARSLQELQSIDPGLDADRVAYLETDWTSTGLGNEELRVALDAVLARMESLPGITRATITSRLPAESSGTTTTEVEGYTPPAGTDAVEMPFAVVGDGYLEAMGIPLLDGRAFGADDMPGGDDVSILVNETAAHRFWGDAGALGRHMRGQGSERWTRTVVGVVGDVPVSRLGESPRPMFYYSARQVSPYAANVVLVARTEGDPAAILAPIRRELSELGPAVVVADQGTLASHFGATLATPRMAARAMGAFSLLALLLAGLGIYAVVSFSVAGRTPELGIRIALGAERSGMVRMVVREIAGVVGVGLVLGGVVWAVVAPRLSGMVYGVTGTDSVAVGGAVAVLLGVSWVAAYVPARRAARADPVEALRSS